MCQSGPVVLPGKLLEKETLKSVELISIITAHGFTYSDSSGLFKISCELNDSIIFKGVGFETRKVRITDSILSLGYMVILLEPKMLVFEETSINAFGTKEEFKKKFLELKINDNSVDLGLTNTGPYQAKLQNDKFYPTVPLVALSPISFLYSKFNEKEKAKRKIAELISESKVIEKKYSRVKVGEWTGLSGEKLTDFILFCNFRNSFLIEASQYEIVKKVGEKLSEYNKLK